MKKTILSTVTAVFAATLLTIASCSKSDDSNPNDAAKFAGTYTMTSPCWSAPRSVAVIANGSSSVNLPLSLGEGTPCYKLLTIPAGVSGNDIQSTTNSVFDACSNGYNVTVSGTLSGNTLTLIYSATNAAGTLTCTFVGSK